MASTVLPKVSSFSLAPSIELLEAQTSAVARQLVALLDDRALQGRGQYLARVTEEALARFARQELSVCAVPGGSTAEVTSPGLVVKRMPDTLGLVANPAELWAISLSTDVLVLEDVSVETALSGDLRRLVDVMRDAVETFAWVLEEPMTEKDVSTWLERLSLPRARVLFVPRAPGDSFPEALGKYTDLRVLRTAGFLMRLQRVRRELNQLIELERTALSGFALEVRALDESVRRAEAKLEMCRERLTEYVERTFEEYTPTVAQTLWESPSLEAVLLRDVKPALDPRLVVDHIRSLDDFDVTRVEPVGVPKRVHVRWRDSVYECRLSFRTVSAIRETLRGQFRVMHAATRSEMQQLRQQFTEWARTIPDRWPGPWQALRRLELPVYSGPQLDELAENPEVSLEEEQKLVHRGLLARVRESKAAAGMLLSFVSLALPFLALAYLDKGGVTGLRRLLVPWLAGATATLSVGIFLLRGQSEKLERQMHEQELLRRFRKNAMAQFCRLIHQFERARVEALEGYLEMLRAWLLESVDQSLEQAKAAERRLADCVSPGQAQMEARRRTLEGLGPEALSRRLMEAGKDLDTLTTSLAKLRAK